MAEETAKLIAAATEYLKQAVELSKEQVPLLVQEYLRWAFVTSVVYSVLGLVMVVGALVAFRWAYKQPRKDNYSYLPLPTAPFGYTHQKISTALSLASITANSIAAVGGAIGLLLLIVNTYILMYVWLAPRAYMLGVLKGLVS